jgi:predicted  nucleic acid-binding Zn-ribbon protein
MSTVENDLHVDQEHDSDTAVAPFSRRAPRISQADVFRAADELLVQGDRPTIDRVRMRLGRGSPNTINDHLDTWWLKLGARLRDIPGQEFPQLPEPVSQTLLRLWNQALDGARAALQATLAERERGLVERAAAIETAAHELTERERVAAVRTAALEESLALAREQLVAANQRAQALESNAQEREAEYARLRARIQTLETACAQGREKLEAAAATHKAERSQFQERHDAAESHWMLELDRARHDAKETTRDYERQLKELRTQIGSLHDDRDHLRQQLAEARAELKAAGELRAQLERHFQRPQPGTGRPTGGAKSKRPAKRKRPA